MEKVSWCVKNTISKRFILMFSDGVSLTVHVKEHVVVIQDRNGNSSRYYHIFLQVIGRFATEKNLPAQVKSRLAYLPRFMELMHK